MGKFAPAAPTESRRPCSWLIATQPRSWSISWGYSCEASCIFELAFPPLSPSFSHHKLSVSPCLSTHNIVTLSRLLRYIYFCTSLTLYSKIQQPNSIASGFPLALGLLRVKEGQRMLPGESRIKSFLLPRIIMSLTNCTVLRGLFTFTLRMAHKSLGVIPFDNSV